MSKTTTIRGHFHLVTTCVSIDLITGGQISVSTLFTSSRVSCDHLCSDSHIILVRKAHKCVKLKGILWNLFASPVLIFGVRWLLFQCKKCLISRAGCYSDVGNCCNMH